jgi:glycosyltransferase involved in cell wall biosynthesis
VAGGDSRQRTALIATVLNEASSIDTLLASVAAQTCPPGEVVIVDGGSTDGTWERLQSWCDRLPLAALRAPGATIARGRNLAIEAASGELIAVTDAGVRMAPDWLSRLLACVVDDVDVVAGFFEPDAHGVFELAMGATVLPAIDDVKAASFLPSSRSVLFRRQAWQAVGGYPAWLDYCEDLVFDLALKHAGMRFVFAPHAVVWFRPRGSLKGLFRQYFLYARGDGKADLWRRRHAIRYATYVLAPWLATRGVWGWLVLALGVAAYARRPYERLWPRLRALSMAQRGQAVALVPLIRLTGDVAKMLGYPAGVCWRLRREVAGIRSRVSGKTTGPTPDSRHLAP